MWVICGFVLIFGDRKCRPTMLADTGNESTWKQTNVRSKAPSRWT